MILALALIFCELAKATPCQRELSVINQPTTERLPRLAIRPGSRINSYKQNLLHKTLREISDQLGPLAVGNLEFRDWGANQTGTNVETGQITLNLTHAKAREDTIRVQLIHEYAHMVFNDHLQILFDGQHKTLREHQLRRYRGELSLGAQTELGEIAACLRPYAELFADFVVVLLEQNPAAIALSQEERKPARHFAKLTPVRGWSRDPQASIAWYTLFDPARVTLWRNYARTLQQARDIQLFLQAFLSATESHLAERRARKGGTAPETLNREFYRHIANLLKIRA